MRLEKSLTAKGCTRAMHIENLDEQFHLSAFGTERDKGNEARQFMGAFSWGPLSSHIRRLMF